MSLTAFVNNPYVISINSRETGIPGSRTLIEQYMMRTRSGLTVVEADLKRVMSSPCLSVWIRTQQNMFFLSVLLLIHTQQTAIAIGLNERVTVRRMRLPRLSEILCRHNGSEHYDSTNVDSRGAL